MDTLLIDEKKLDKGLLMTVSGIINSYTYGLFEEKIYSAIKVTDVILEFSKITNMSSSGLGVLMSACDDAEESGHKIFILNPSQVVKRCIDSTGFSDMFKIIHSIDEI